MEFKARVIVVTLLLTLVLAKPCFSRGMFQVRNMGSEVYEIDYRGPETHTYIPPPNRDRPRVHHQISMTHHRPKTKKHKNPIGQEIHA